MKEAEKKKVDEIELRSEDFQEVLSDMPPWILRWGITTVATIVVILIIGSSIFKYPDTITSTITLTSSKPAANIVAKSSGKLQKLYVEDNQTVQTGDYLAVIENPANTADIQYLKKFLQTYKSCPDSIDSLPMKEMNLGSCQSLYSSYYLTLSQYIQFKQIGYYQDKIDMMKNRIVRNEKHYQDVLRQKELVKKQLALTYKQYQRDSILHQKGAVSGKDLETTNNLYIGGQLSMENMLSTLENLSMQLAQMKEELLDTEYQYIDKESTLITQLKSLTIQLLTEIQAWEINYVLITPIPGKVTFTNYWIENQNILSGDIAFSVIPSSNNKLIGKALLPTERSGKVKVGQKVNIKFSNYPDNEFGIVRGIVRNISLISVKVETKNHYVVEVELPERLTTTYGKELPFVSAMEGQADIITDDLSLLERILLPIKKILTESL